MRKRLLIVMSLAALLLLPVDAHQARAQTVDPGQIIPASASPLPEAQPMAEASSPSAMTDTLTLTPKAYLPIAIAPSGLPPASGCPITGTAKFDLISVQGGFYKSNALTDENADFRLSILGYRQTNETLQLVDYGGPADTGAPQLHGIFEPNRVPQFKAAHKRFDWKWDETALPPYGTRNGLNNEWPVSVLDLAAAQGEPVFVPERNVNNNSSGTVAMVLYADDDEVMLHYGDTDRVDSGYTVYLANFCVDPSLVALYRAQLQSGKRATGRLPAIRNNEKIGMVKTDVVTVAVRDNGPFLDPRSRKDWWQGISTADSPVHRINLVHATGTP